MHSNYFYNALFLKASSKALLKFENMQSLRQTCCSFAVVGMFYHVTSMFQSYYFWSTEIMTCIGNRFQIKLEMESFVGYSIVCSVLYGIIITLDYVGI